MSGDDVVLCVGPVPTEAERRLGRHGRVVTISAGGGDVPNDFLEAAVVVVAKANVRISRREFDAAKRLRVVARSGVGIDNIDVGEATRRQIPVVITPGATSFAVAEGALALLMCVGKRLPALHDLTVTGRWHDRD